MTSSSWRPSLEFLKRRLRWLPLIVSLVIQTLLLCLAGFRKHVVSIRWSKKTDYSWVGVPLGRLRGYGRDSEDKGAEHLLIFWAPFFLVHLGGQDTITAMFMPFWTYAVLKEYKGWRGWLAGRLFPLQRKLRSDKMAQSSLISYSLFDKPNSFKSTMQKAGFKQSWDHCRYTTFDEVRQTLKELVFQELKKKMIGIEGRDGYKRYTEHRGQWALQRKGYYKEFGWSVEAEFNESILLWHIATDLLFNEPTDTEPEI